MKKANLFVRLRITYPIDMKLKKNIGNGSFGQVFQCFDHKSGTMVALKILRNIKRLHKQGLIEASILEGLRDKD